MIYKHWLQYVVGTLVSIIQPDLPNLFRVSCTHFDSAHQTCTCSKSEIKHEINLLNMFKVNPFLANVPVLHSLKTQGFLTFTGGYNGSIGQKWVNKNYTEVLTSKLGSYATIITPKSH